MEQHEAQGDQALPLGAGPWPGQPTTCLWQIDVSPPRTIVITYLGPHMAVFLGHTLLTEKNGHTDSYGFVSTTCRHNMGFIGVIYANDREIMAMRANAAKHSSLTEK